MKKHYLTWAVLGLVLLFSGCFTEDTKQEKSRANIKDQLWRNAKPGNFALLGKYYFPLLDQHWDAELMDHIGLCIQRISRMEFGFPLLEKRVSMADAKRRIALWWETTGREKAMADQGRVLVDIFEDEAFDLASATPAELLFDRFPPRVDLLTESFNQLTVLSKTCRTDLIRGLSGNEQQKFRCAVLLTRIGDAKGILALEEFTKNARSEVKWRALHDLVIAGNRSGIQQLEKHLGSKVPGDRLAAAQILFLTDPERAQTVLIRHLDEEDPLHAEQAAMVLDQLGCRGAVPFILDRALLAENQSSRFLYFNIALGLDVQKTRELIFEKLEDPKESISSRKAMAISMGFRSSR